jgi:N-acetylglucosamine-6-sulfatase
MTDVNPAEPPPVLPRRLALVGDSITAEGEWTDWLPDLETHNLGLSGDTTDDLIARLDDIIQLEPTDIALLIGTNDLGTRRTVEHLVRNIEFVLVSLRRDLPGVRMLLQSIMPRGSDFADDIRDANRHLRQFAPSVRAQYLDLWPALAGDDGGIQPRYSDDRLHLTPGGYDAWLGELRPALDRLAEAPPMSTPITIIPEGMRR